MKTKTDVHVPGGIALAEQAVHLLRARGGAALAYYYLGGLPFLLGLLYFGSDMSRNPDAGSYCGPAAAGMALLYIWMKWWHVCFCRRLWSTLQDAEPEPWSWRRGMAVAARQALLQGTGLVVMFFSAVIVLPMAWTYAFYQNLSVMDNPRAEGLKGLFAEASHQARLWPGQNHVLLLLISLFGLFVFANTAAALMLLPYLLKWFLGIETAFTVTSVLHVITNTTFLAVACALTYACVDPIIKAAYTLRCFYGRSRRTGDDLRAGLKPFFMALSISALFWLGSVAVAGAGSTHGNAPNTYSTSGQEEVVIRQLDTRIDQTLSQRRFAWRLPRKHPVEETKARQGWFWDSIRWLGEKIGAMFRAVDRWLEALAEWLQKHLPRGRRGPARQRDWGGIIRMAFYGIAGGLVLLLLMLLRKWLRARRHVPRDPAAVKAAAEVDLNDENVTAGDLPREQWLDLAREMMARQELRQALRAYYLAVLAQLGRHGRVIIARHKSNRDYVAELLRHAHAEPELAKRFDWCVSVFECAWYGMYPVVPDQLADFISNQERIEALV